jgi:outer membrane autotransporter protein
MVGFDQRIARNSFFGAALGYDNAFQKFGTIPSQDQIDTFRSAIYGGSTFGNVYADVYAGYTKNWHKTRRDIAFGDFSGTARSKYDDNMVSVGIEVGRKFTCTRSLAAFVPSIGFHRVHLYSPNITESGAGSANLHIRSDYYNSLRMPVGAKLSRSFASKHITWSPEFRAHYIREMADTTARVVTSFDSVRSVTFQSGAGDLGRDIARFGLGLTATGFANRLHARLDYDYEVYRHTAMGVLGATVGVKW